MNIFGIVTLHSSGQRSQMLVLTPAGAVSTAWWSQPRVLSLIPTSTGAALLNPAFFPVYSWSFCCHWWAARSRTTNFLSNTWLTGTSLLVCKSASGRFTGSKCGCSLPPLEACPTLTLGLPSTKLGTDVPVHYISYLVLTFYARLVCDRSQVLSLLYSELVSCPATIRASVLLFSPAFFSHWLDFLTSATSSV